jgi:hypothetical protein
MAWEEEVECSKEGSCKKKRLLDCIPVFLGNLFIGWGAEPTMTAVIGRDHGQGRLLREL